MNLQGKRVLVTGGNGFLGKHLYTALQARGARVFTPGFDELSGADLRRGGYVDDLFGLLRPHIVIHAAARVGGIAANLAKPGEFFYDNLMMGMNVLEKAKLCRVEKFVQIGSACEYPKDAPMPLTESDIWNGYPEASNSSYAIAKRAMLEMGDAYRKQYSMNILHLIPTNLYGPGDNFNLETSHVISALIKKFETARLEKRPVVQVWGTGEATRDFLYVKDAARGVVHFTEFVTAAEPVNMGSGKEIQIRDLAVKIADMCGYTGEVQFDVSKPDGQPRRVLGTTRAKLFGFEAATDLTDGLRETILYYRSLNGKS